MIRKGQLRLRLRIDHMTSHVNFHENLNLIFFFCFKCCTHYSIYAPIVYYRYLDGLYKQKKIKLIKKYCCSVTTKYDLYLY